MKKIILIASAIIATVSMGYAANALQKGAEQSKCEAGFRCNICKGSGFQGNTNCFHCKGTGRDSSY